MSPAMSDRPKPPEQVSWIDAVLEGPALYWHCVDGPVVEPEEAFGYARAELAEMREKIASLRSAMQEIVDGYDSADPPWTNWDMKMCAVAALEETK